MKHDDPQTDLPSVHIAYRPDWTPDVTVADKPYKLPEPPVPINVRDPRDVGRLVALDLGQAVHVIAVNPEGGMYTEICEAEPIPPATGPEPTAPSTSVPEPTSHAEFPLGVVGRGFLPGEQVCVAVVVAARDADDDGRATLPLPAPLLERLPSAVVLLGRTSGTVVVHDPAIDALAAGVA
ncbi:hypothetical protein ACFQ8T_04340 [Isoptericola sp. NPDC056618]|uniref:hypothetical protein n=1 Tax=Isoptericola sp. NPDC056618 TaxID=3345878 RepID=UPI00368FB1DF